MHFVRSIRNPSTPPPHQRRSGYASAKVHCSSIKSFSIAPGLLLIILYLLTAAATRCCGLCTVFPRRNVSRLLQALQNIARLGVVTEGTCLRGGNASLNSRISRQSSPCLSKRIRVQDNNNADMNHERFREKRKRCSTRRQR